MTTGARLDSGGLLRALTSAKTTKTRIAVPMIWSKKAVVTLTPSTPLPGSVEKIPCVVMVCCGSTMLMRSA